MLFGKVISEFKDHYKCRLLSVADRTFDGVYSQRFKGTNYKSNEVNAHLLLKILSKHHFSSNDLMVYHTRLLRGRLFEGSWILL